MSDAGTSRRYRTSLQGLGAHLVFGLGTGLTHRMLARPAADPA